MNRIAPMRRAALFLFLGGGLLLAGGLAIAQSPALPATRPTAAQPPAPAPVPASVRAAVAVPAQPAGHRAEVVYSAGQLSITADNSSLNQILRDVARLTGMKITGGVADQRVFGKYGPGAPAGILAGLLEGTGSNMLLRESASHAPEELILTPRQGGVTPPNPNAPGFDDDAPASDEQSAEPPAPPRQQIQVPQQPSAPPAPTSSGFFGAPTVAPATGLGTAPGATPPSTDSSNPQSPNGVKTPQQIFQQLQQLQSQQQPNPK
jgi:hypothetical protein